jgi:hypothetical protein
MFHARAAGGESREIGPKSIIGMAICSPMVPRLSGSEQPIAGRPPVFVP